MLLLFYTFRVKSLPLRKIDFYFDMIATNIKITSIMSYDRDAAMDEIAEQEDERRMDEYYAQYDEYYAQCDEEDRETQMMIDEYYEAAKNAMEKTVGLHSSLSTFSEVQRMKMEEDDRSMKEFDEGEAIPSAIETFEAHILTMEKILDNHDARMEKIHTKEGVYSSSEEQKDN